MLAVSLKYRSLCFSTNEVSSILLHFAQFLDPLSRVPGDFMVLVSSDWFGFGESVELMSENSEESEAAEEFGDNNPGEEAEELGDNNPGEECGEVNGEGKFGCDNLLNLIGDVKKGKAGC